MVCCILDSFPPCYRKSFFFNNDIEIEILIYGSSLSNDIVYQLTVALVVT